MLNVQTMTTQLHVRVLLLALLVFSICGQTTETPPDETPLNALKEKFESLEDAVRSSLRNHVNIQDVSLLAISGQASRCSPPAKVAFSVVRSSSLTLDSGTGAQTVTYDILHVNEGAGYNLSSGHFQAPVSGLYQFSMTLLAEAEKRAYVQLKHNGQHITTAYGYNYGTGSIQMVLRLMEGDNVWTELLPGGSIHSNVQKYVTFSGFLL